MLLLLLPPPLLPKGWGSHLLCVALRGPVDGRRVLDVYTDAAWRAHVVSEKNAQRERMQNMSAFDWWAHQLQAGAVATAARR